MFYLNSEGEPVEVDLASLSAELRTAARPVQTFNWLRSLENMDNRRVASTRRGAVHVSTVFLIFGDAPFLWETMILGGKRDGYQDRTTSVELAVQQHKIAVKRAFPRDPPPTRWGALPGLNPDGTVGSRKVEEILGPTVWERLLRDDLV